MKFIIATQEFIYLLSKCLNVVPQKPAVPILANILLEATGKGELIVTATDLTVGVRAFTEAKIIEPGITALPAKRLYPLVRELTAPNIEVTTNSNEVTEIQAGTSRFKLHGFSASEFPNLPDVTGAMNFKINQEELREMLFKTAFAVSREDTRYALTGVFLGLANGLATFIGTDGKRLSKKTLPVAIDSSFTGQFIIPIKAVDEIQKNLEDKEGMATIFLMNDKIAVESNNSLTITKLLSGDYPDVSSVIPKSSDNIVSLHREELISLLRQVSLFAAEGEHTARFTFVPGELYMAANTLEVGEGKVSMPVNYQGAKMEIAFNPSYFLDILKHSKSETVSLGLTDAYNPGLITDSEEVMKEGKESLFVLMPLRIEQDVP